MENNRKILVVEIGTERNFGIVFSIVFMLIALFPLMNEESISIWSLIVSISFLLVALVVPNVLILPNKLWFKFGILVGSIVAPIVITLVYFIAVVPTGVIMRLMRKDLLQKKFDENVRFIPELCG